MSRVLLQNMMTKLILRSTERVSKCPELCFQQILTWQGVEEKAMRDTHVTKAQPVTVCYQQIYGNSVDFFCNKRLAHDHLCAYERRILLRNIKVHFASVYYASAHTILLHWFYIPLQDNHWRKKWQPTPVFLPGKSQGRGSLVGCRLWGRTESDTTEAT